MNFIYRTSRVLIPIVTLVAIGLGCRLFSGKTSSNEVVFATTEVGAPQGAPATKNIGPSGGTLTSPDGRLTLTVPQNAVAESTSFSIQPITNKAENGIGNGYRLEPSGKMFLTPLQISVQYGDEDLKGTIPEAMTLAYQDESRAWHLQKAIKVDKDTKTITVSTMHFSDWSFLTRLKLSPDYTKLHYGESVAIAIVLCEEQSLFRWMIDHSEGQKCSTVSAKESGRWRVTGVGTIAPAGDSVIYTAPSAKYLAHDVGYVVFSYELEQWSEAGNEKKTGDLTSMIVIVDRGYKVSGNAGGDTVFDGKICDLETPFTLKTNNPFVPSFKFTPSKNLPTVGTWKLATADGLVGSGGGEYTLEGSDTEKTGIYMFGNSHGHMLSSGERYGGGDMHLTLTPLTAADGCSE